MPSSFESSVTDIECGGHNFFNTASFFQQNNESDDPYAALNWLNFNSNNYSARGGS